MRPPSAPAAPLLLLTALAATSLAGCGGSARLLLSATPQAVEATGAWQSSARGSGPRLHHRGEGPGAGRRRAAGGAARQRAPARQRRRHRLGERDHRPPSRRPGPRPLLLAEAAVAGAGGGAGPPRRVALQQASLARWLSGPGPGLRAARRRPGRGRGAAAGSGRHPGHPELLHLRRCRASPPGRRKSATLVHESAHAAYYATDDVKAGLVDLATAGPGPASGTRLDSYYEGIAYGAINPGGAKNILRGAHRRLRRRVGLRRQREDDLPLHRPLGEERHRRPPPSWPATSTRTTSRRPTPPPAAPPRGAGQGSNGADMLYLMDPVHYVVDGLRHSTRW